VAAKKGTKKTAKKPEKPEKKEPTRDQQLDALQAKINAAYRGKGVIRKASEVVLPYYYLRRPCGIIDLDIATGGGLPAGGLVEFIGPEGSCKSYLINLYMRRQQEIFGKDFAGAMAMTEMLYDKLFAKMHGLRVAYHVDEIARMEALEGKPFTKEESDFLNDQMGRFDITMAESAEVLYDILLDLLYPDLYNIIGIDSWGSMLTMLEEGKGMKDKTRGGSAKVNAEFMRRYTSIMMGAGGNSPVHTTVIGINQMRDSMDPNKSWEIQGGWALKHGKFISIMLNPGKPLYQNANGEITEGAGDEGLAKLTKVGKVIKWRILKGKAGCHDGPTGQFRYFFATGADLEHALILEAIKCAVMSMAGSWYTFDDIRIQGRDAWVMALRNDHDLRQKMEDAVMEAHGVQPNYC